MVIQYMSGAALDLRLQSLKKQRERYTVFIGEIADASPKASSQPLGQGQAEAMASTLAALLHPKQLIHLRISQWLPAVENPEHDVVSQLIAFGANDGMVGRGL